MGDARISFVILMWNSERHVRSCVESVLEIGDLCLEIQVEDNGSVDDTIAVLRAIAERDERLRIEELEENLGTTVPRNIALRRVSSAATHVCILDSDTIVNRAAFETMIDVLDVDPSIGVVGPTMKNSLGEVQLSGRNLPTLGIKLGKAVPFSNATDHAAEAEVPATPIVDGLQDVGYLLSACWLMPISSLDSVGLFDENIFYAPEDVDWCLRCHLAGLRVVRAYDAHIIHEYQRLSHKSFFSKTNVEHLRGLVYYFRKHNYLFKAPELGTGRKRL